MTNDELREAYEAYFWVRMKDPAFADYVYSIGRIDGLNNLLFTFFQAGAHATGAY